MKNFRLYSGIKNPKQQTIWIGCLLLVIAIAVAVVGFFNYANLPARDIQDADNSLEKLVFQQLYIAGGMGVIGIILLVGGAFAAFDFNDEDKKIKKEPINTENN
jgi:hypothetical protein